MKKVFNYLTLGALALGIVFGLVCPQYVDSISFIGTWYVKILKYFITPVIFTSIASTIYETSKKKNGLILKSVVLFTIMFVTTFLITSLMVSLINPGKGYVFDATEWTGSTIEFGLKGSLKTLLPSSWKEVFVSPKVFAIIVFAWIFGKVGSLIKKSEGLFNGIAKLKVILFKILEYYMYVTPLAVFSLISTTVAKQGSILLGLGLKYIGVAYLCSIICVIVVMILPLRFITGMKPWEYIKKVHKIWIMTVTTCSSAATLPYTVQLCKEELGIPEEITDVVVPLGCTIHMCGGAVSFALLGLCCAQMYGVQITFAAYIMMIISSLLINMAAPGIPGGGIVIGASYLEMMGIPLGFIGFYSGIYKFLDMIYTTLNVTGDISANIILNEFNKKRNK